MGQARGFTKVQIRRVISLGAFASLVIVAGCGGSAKPLSAASVSVPVTRCPTSYGASGEHLGVTPRTITTTLTAQVAKQVEYYVGGLTILGPAGWKCSSAVGADGSAGITLSPPPGSPPLGHKGPTGGTTNTATRSSEGVSLSTVPASTASMASIACPFFPDAGEELDYNFRCSGHVGPDETVSHPYRNVVFFRDPPWVKGNGLASGNGNPARGAVLFLPHGKRSGSSASIAECTLPASDAAVCNAILDVYLAGVSQKSPGQFDAPWPPSPTPVAAPASPPATTPAESQPGFFAQASNGVIFIQWTRTGNSVAGTLSESYTTSPNRSQTTNESDSFTGIINGTSITLTLNTGENWNGTLTGSGVTLSYAASGGTLHTFAFSPSTVADYNAAVTAIQQAANRAAAVE